MAADTDHHASVGLGVAPARFSRAIDAAFPTSRDLKPPEEGPTNPRTKKKKHDKDHGHHHRKHGGRDLACAVAES
jgi:hypothetical protein